MTPAEFQDQAEAYNWRREREHELLAWQTRWILAGLVGTPPSMNELLGRPEPEGEASEEDFEQFNAVLRKLSSNKVTKEAKNGD